MYPIQDIPMKQAPVKFILCPSKVKMFALSKWKKKYSKKTFIYLILISITYTLYTTPNEEDTYVNNIFCHIVLID